MLKIFREMCRTKNNIIGIKERIRFFFENPSCKVLTSEKLVLQTKYSQAGQDTFIQQTFFKNKKEGIFCDVGGNHPININNTYHFENIGWVGFCFEPLPEMKKLWKKERTATFFPYAATSKKEKLTFSIVENLSNHPNQFDALSYVTDSLSHDLGDIKTQEISVEGKTISSVFAENNVTHVDYMSMDVEGHEMEALKGIDFDKITINVLTIENNSTGHSRFGDPTIQNFMKDKGYIFYARIKRLDDIYVHKDFIY